MSDGHEVKLIGSLDAKWDEVLENEDHSIDTRLLGKEDVFWDIDGNGDQSSFVDRLGTERPFKAINASHLPLPVRTREKLNGATNVADGLNELAALYTSGNSSAIMEQNKTVSFTSNMTHEERQSLIDAQIKNLGGKTLTIKFAEAVDLAFSYNLLFSGFYNGNVIIDLATITVTDSANLEAIFSFYDCTAKMEITNGNITHILTDYGVYAERCPHIYLNNVIFSGSGGNDNYAFYGRNANGIFNNCSFNSDNEVFIDGFITDDAVRRIDTAIDTHNTSATAHENQFSQKADKTHTHSAKEANADPAGTAEAKVTAHNEAEDAHDGVLAPLASPVFTGEPKATKAPKGDNSDRIATTGFVAEALEDSGIVDANVEAHNKSATAHSGILAPLSNPVFTGTPQAPTPTVGTSNKQIATTEFVNESIKTGGEVDKKITAHNAAGDAHKALFDAKAAVNHTHTPESIGADKYGTAANSINTHNLSDTAHANLFSRKADKNHTHSAAEANADPAGTAEEKVTAHNSDPNAHAALINLYLPPGIVMPFAGNSNTIPDGYLLCNGQAVSRTQYAALFAVIGVTYGSGDGSGTFNVPDFQGAFLRGYKAGVTEPVGVKQEEGLPDIELAIRINRISGTSSGALIEYGNDAQSVNDTEDNDEYMVKQSALSKTSRAGDLIKSDLYGKSEHVTPENYAVQYIIKY